MNKISREAPHETLKKALLEGDLQTALSVLARLDRRELLETILRCGFSVGDMASKKAMFAHLQPQILKACKLKVDGYGLRSKELEADQNEKIGTTVLSEEQMKGLCNAARYLRDVAFNAHHLVEGHPTGLLFLATRLGPGFQAELLKDRFKLDTDTAKTLVRYAASLPPRHLNEDQTLRVLTYFPAMLELVNQAKQRISERKGNTVSAPVAHLLV